MSSVFAAAGSSDDDDFGAFAAAPPPIDPFAVDDPFADIVHTPSAAPSAAAAASTSAATFGSPLLSFSPVATATSVAPFADVFAAPAEAELLSFSPLLLSTAAPSSLSSFLLDSPAPVSMSTTSSSRGGAEAKAHGFSLLPPPRAATAPTLSPVLASPPKAASFSGHVSLGQLLSFSPVASPSASAASFADSFGSSSAAATTATSVFGDDELFSLSTVDMTLELPLAAAAPEPLDVYAAAFSSPAAFSSSSVFGSGSESANTPVGSRSANGDAHAPAFPSPAASASPPFPSPVAALSPAFGSASVAVDVSSTRPDVALDLERMSLSSSRGDSSGGNTTEEDAKAGVGSDLGASLTSVESKWDGEDGSEGAGSSFAELHVPAQADRTPATAATGDLGVLSASGASSAVEDAVGDDAFSAFDEIDESEAAPSAFAQSSAAPFQEPKSVDSPDFGESAFRGDAADDDDVGDFEETTTTTTEIGEFGDFAQSASGGAEDDDDDDFGDFAQSSSGVVGGGGADDDDDFGDFVQSSGDEDGFSDFAQPPSFAGGDFASASLDDDFGDFGSPPSHAAADSFVSANAAPAFPVVESTSALDLESFFSQAFPVQSPAVPLEAAPLVPSAPTRNSFKDLFQDKDQQASANSLISTIYRSAVESYFQDAPSAADAGAVPTGVEHYLSELKATRLKHLKFVLTEKIQEASRHDGIFPHGSEKHHVLLSLVNSDDEKKMRDALTSVQNSLFSSSVNDAMMRFARQAALSAKAKIAEQAAHQQASSRGSLLATTRQLLSRSGGGGGGASATSAVSSGGGHDSSDASSSSSSGYGGSGNGDDSPSENTISGSESTGRRRHSGSSEADLAPRGAGSGSGGLMKKFQDRFSSFSSSRGRTRVVSLRRKGQSGEDVRAMELNMDSISGGLDQVKWKCAVFLYDVDEVAQVAPSQIRILSYPSKEVLAAKSDRAALLKFLKPGAIWTIDIGASNNNVLNAW